MHIRWRQTTWVVHVPIITHIPGSVRVAPYGTLDICLFFFFFFFLLLSTQNKYANEVLNIHIQWRQITWVILVIWVILLPTTTHIPSFVTVAYTELLIYLPFSFLANQKRYENKVLNIRIRWQQTMWVIFLLTTTHKPSSVPVKVAYI